MLSRRLWVTGCRDDASRATVGLPSAADAPLQRSELAKSANSGSRLAIDSKALRVTELEDRPEQSRMLIFTA